MKRIDEIFYTLKKLDKGSGVTTKEISKKLNLDRANVSSDLNKLFRQDKIIKIKGRPVRYSVKNKREIYLNINSRLDQLSIYNPSLKKVINQAKAALLYPPKGIHSIILGETGVGKSMLAYLMYEYLALLNKENIKIPFLHFNCADYSSNPQLLTSQLFGVKKGTFTGATEDRLGLIEKSNGGILFLDEIHRLPSEGQEMLFTFIDTGFFRRLGEIENLRESSVLILCATTQSKDSCLLQTFLRRIPMVIKIPGLKERSLEERLYLIEYFLKDESIRIGEPIYISFNSMICLVTYDCPNNIGQLKNDIKLLTAKVYTDFLINNKRTIKINSFDLPQELIKYLNNDNLLEKKLLKSHFKDSKYFIYDINTVFRIDLDWKCKNEAIKIYCEILKQIQNFNLNPNFNIEYIQNKISINFKKYLNLISNNYNNYTFNVNEKILNKILFNIREIFKKKLNLKLKDTNLKLIKIHIDMIFNRQNIKIFLYDNVFENFFNELSIKYSIVLTIKKLIENEFNINLNKNETIFLLLLFSFISENF